MTATTTCRPCGVQLLASARFCHGCGAPVNTSDGFAEYKHVTVLFADVVHSMDIAAAVGAERLREIMAALANCCAGIVERYGGTVGSFTGDGVMALFGAPAAIEDHAVHACMAALAIQEETRPLAAEVIDRDGIELRLRVGLNSGEVIAGKVGSGPFGYTAIGEQVGVAQRMESVAPPGGVMLSDSTARLVEHAATLGAVELVRIKGREEPVPVRLLRGIDFRHGVAGLRAPRLIGRQWEMASIANTLAEAKSGRGRVIEIVGPPGIGKTRMGDESASLGARLGMKVFTTFSESYAASVPFGAVTRLLRDVFGVDANGAAATRERLRIWLASADSDDLILLDDLLGIGDPEVSLPVIDPDARRRRLAALIISAFIAQSEPAVYVIEDAHWIDESSESLLSQFLSVVSKTPSVVVITYRPEYTGALAGTIDANVLALSPLNNTEAAELAIGLLGTHPSARRLTELIVERTAGNPFFVEEIIRDLASRDVLVGGPGEYECVEDISEILVPSTLHATIAARIDRLSPPAKRTLFAAAVLGFRFSAELLTSLAEDVVVGELVDADFIEPVDAEENSEYVFRHPMVRTVAYESQLSSVRSQLHRRAAAMIEARRPDAVDENAALIAAHLEAAGELRSAFDWHMRAAAWSTNRDISAARVSWQHARSVADKLPETNVDRVWMRIAARTLLCGSTWRVGGTVKETGFEELRQLTTTSGDRLSLAIGMAGLLMTLTFHEQYREASQLCAEYVGLVESLNDPTMTVALLYGAMWAKLETGEMNEVLRLAQRVIDLADGDPTKGNLILGSPLAAAMSMRGCARMLLGLTGWCEDFEEGIAIAREFDSTSRVLTITLKYLSIENGLLLADETALADTAEALKVAESSGDDFTLALARLSRGITLIHHDGWCRPDGFALLADVREMASRERFTKTALPAVDTETARQMAHEGDLSGAIELARAVVDKLFTTGEMIYRGASTTVLVEALITRRTATDLTEAQDAIERLAGIPTDPGLVLNVVPLLRLRALLAHARGDDAGYANCRDRYSALATACGFTGHMRWAREMQ